MWQRLNEGRWNIYWALIRSLLLVMLLYSISRVAFYLFNLSFFPGITLQRFLVLMAGGLRFDLSATLYSNSLVILLMILPVTCRFKNWYKAMLKCIFFVCNTIAFAANTVDFIYYRFTLRRTTLSVLNQFENETNLGRLFFRFLFDYWYATLFFMTIIAIMVVLFNRIRYRGPQMKSVWKFYGFGTLGFLISIGLFIGGARGGFRESTRPITLSNAAAYVKDPREINLVLNTPFALMRTAKANIITKVNYFSSERDLNEVFNPVKMPVDTLSFQSKNVVVLILESFSKEFIGAYNKNLE
ncbi:MAG: LTA synthase family protein, partial [Cytophagales bacterium]